MFLERMLIAVREGDATAVAEYREEHERVREGIAFLMQRQFGERLAPFDTTVLGEALYAFYWGARLLKLMYPATDPVAQLAQVQKVMNHAFGLERASR